jgi:hypothetical protein
MAGINLGPAFNADLITLTGCNPDTVDATTLDVVCEPGGRTTVRVIATARAGAFGIRAD